VRPDRLPKHFHAAPTFVARGGHAEVWSAFDYQRRDHVAIKLLRDPLDIDAVIRLGREIAVLKSIDHPNVVRVLETDSESAGPIWYSMPLSNGTLKDHVGALDDQGVAAMVEQVCRGLEQLHTRREIHCDVKPENVLCFLEDDGIRWVVSDLGIIKRLDTHTITDGAPRGTFDYMAPELYRGREAATPASDVYSLGRTIYFVVTGQRPQFGVQTPNIPNSPWMNLIGRATMLSEDARLPNTAEVMAEVALVRRSLAKTPPAPPMSERLQRFRDAIAVEQRRADDEQSRRAEKERTVASFCEEAAPYFTRMKMLAESLGLEAGINDHQLEPLKRKLPGIWPDVAAATHLYATSPGERISIRTGLIVRWADAGLYAVLGHVASAGRRRTNTDDGEPLELDAGRPSSRLRLLAALESLESEYSALLEASIDHLSSAT
jgi:serine/threonine protein kinase